MIAKNEETRDKLVSLYKNELQQVIASPENAEKALQYVLYLVHKLEYFGEFTAEMKVHFFVNGRQN